MRIVLILLGAAVVAYLLIKGVRAFLAERRDNQQSPQITNDKE